MLEGSAKATAMPVPAKAATAPTKATAVLTKAAAVPAAVPVAEAPGSVAAQGRCRHRQAHQGPLW